MKRLALLALLLAPAAAFAAKPSANSFGAARTVKTAPLALSDALKAGASDKPVLVSGTVKSVCQMEGCWIELSDKEASVRVMFKGHTFTVPRDIAGKSVEAEGILSKKTESEETRRHFAEDAGKSKDEIEAIKGDETSWSFVASSVTVR